MATSSHDPLLSLRQSIVSHSPVTLSTSTDSSNPTDDFAKASHLVFVSPQPHSISLDQETRFISSADKPVDLRSIYFAWTKKDDSIPDYLASTQKLNDELAAAGKTGVQNLVFVERLDLITWLEGASDEIEQIKPLEGDNAARAAAQLASGAAGGVSTVPSSLAGARLGKQIDPRLQEIYNLERRMGDRNTVLRGAKPMVSVSIVEVRRPQIDKSRISPTCENM